jgi:hypothetical protein
MSEIGGIPGWAGKEDLVWGIRTAVESRFVGRMINGGLGIGGNWKKVNRGLWDGGILEDWESEAIGRSSIRVGWEGNGGMKECELQGIRDGLGGSVCHWKRWVSLFKVIISMGRAFLVWLAWINICRASRLLLKPHTRLQVNTHVGIPPLS